MTGINHIVTGGLIGALIPQPLVALPLAVISHFILDMLPHYGDNPIDHMDANSRLHILVLVDTILCVLFFGALLLLRPDGWLVIMAAGAAAQLPDLMWLPNYRRARKGLAQRPYNLLLRLHKRIQWAERPSFFSALLEMLWLVAATALLVVVVNSAGSSALTP